MVTPEFQGLKEILLAECLLLKKWLFGVYYFVSYMSTIPIGEVVKSMSFTKVNVIPSAAVVHKTSKLFP